MRFSRIPATIGLAVTVAAVVAFGVAAAKRTHSAHPRTTLRRAHAPAPWRVGRTPVLPAQPGACAVDGGADCGLTPCVIDIQANAPTIATPAAGSRAIETPAGSSRAARAAPAPLADDVPIGGNCHGHVAPPSAVRVSAP